MKQKTTLLLLIVSFVLVYISISFAGFGLGMAGAVKKRVKKLDVKVKAKKDEARRQSVVEEVEIASIFGTAAKGVPIVSAAVTLKDANGSQKTTTTGSNGKYSIEIEDLTLPCIIKVIEGTSTYFSIAITSGTCNIHPYTDIVTRSHFWINKGINDLDSAFENNYAALGTLPTAAVIDAIKAVIMDVVSVILDRNGIDSSTYDIITSSFNADSTGFDKVIEETQFTIDPSSSTVEIKDTVSDLVLSTYTYVSTGSSVTVTKAAGNPIELITLQGSSYNILLAQVSGGNPPYTFLLETGVGFQPMGMTLVTEGNSCYLRGNPSVGSESAFARTFGLCAKDIGGNFDCVDPRFTYTVTSGAAVWSGPYAVTRLGDGGCTYNNSGTLTMDITVDGSQFSGTCSLDGIELRWIPGCAFAWYTTGDGTVSATISGNTISNGTLTYSIPDLPGDITWSWTATISGNTLSGTTPEGSFTLTRQGSSAPPPPVPAEAPISIHELPKGSLGS